VFKVTAIDSSGNITAKEVAYMVNSTDVTLPAPSSTVASELAFTLAMAPAPFPAFAPGVAQQYLTTAVPRITSTGADAPISNSAVNLTFRQNITATESLRTGAYGKTLTFTLSTTAP
jgi:hypothetical protein